MQAARIGLGTLRMQPSNIINVATSVSADKSVVY